MPRKVALFDLDNTLILRKHYVDRSIHPKEHMHPIILTGNGEHTEYFAINLIAMREIFAALIARDVQIGFITAGRYLPSTLQCLEQIYSLPPGSFANAIFICSTDYGDWKVPKGQKITAAKNAKLFDQDAEIWLIDDHNVHLMDAQTEGYNIIKARGFPMDAEANDTFGLADLGLEPETVDHGYLDEIIAAFDLKIKDKISLSPTVTYKLAHS